MNRRSLFRTLFAGAPLAVGQARDKGDGVDAGLNPGHPADEFGFSPPTMCSLCGGTIMNMLPWRYLSAAKSVLQCSAYECRNRIPWIQRGSFVVRRLSEEEQGLLAQREHLAFLLYGAWGTYSSRCDPDKDTALDVALRNIDEALSKKLREA